MLVYKDDGDEEEKELCFEELLCGEETETEDG